MFTLGLASPPLGAGELLAPMAGARFWKNPAMLCCFGPDLMADAGFFCDVRGVQISLPSIPRAILL